MIRSHVRRPDGRRRRARRFPRASRVLPVPLLVAVALLVAACGGAAGEDATLSDDAADGDATASDASQAATDDSGADGSATDGSGTDDPSAPEDDGRDAFPVTVTVDGREVTVEERPTRIVSLSPTATEMLFAVGAGDQVVAVDDQSDFPPEVPTTDLSGFQPNAEAIAEYDPDLVVASDDPGDLAASLEAIGVPTLLLSAAETLDDTYAQIEQVGAATGHVADAAAVVADMRREVEAILAGAPRPEEPLTYYHELDPTFFSATSDTFIGEVYGLLGLENVADAAADAGTAYPQLSAEYVIEADPDLVFLADTECCGQTPETFASRPGFEQLTAVRNDAVVPLDDDVASRWGPRVVEFLRVVAERVAALEPAAAG